MTITLNDQERTALFTQHPSTAHKGGFQALLIHLQGNYNAPTNEISLSLTDRERIHRYAFKYKNGGWQSVLKTIFERSLGPNLSAN
jgi:hypothetical protein